MSGAFYALHYSRYTRWTSSNAALFWTQALIIDRRLNSSHWPRSSTERRFHQLAHSSSGRTTSCGRWVLGMLAYCDRSSRDMVYIGFSLEALPFYRSTDFIYSWYCTQKQAKQALKCFENIKKFLCHKFPAFCKRHCFWNKTKGVPVIKYFLSVPNFRTSDPSDLWTVIDPSEDVKSCKIRVQSPSTTAAPRLQVHRVMWRSPTLSKCALSAFCFRFVLNLFCFFCLSAVDEADHTSPLTQQKDIIVAS